MIVRAPIAAPAPTVTNGPIDTSAPIDASSGDGAETVDARRGRAIFANSDTAWANAEYGSSVWSAAHGRRRIARLGGAENHGRGARRRELGHVARVGDKREIAGLRLLDAGDTDDVELAVTFETALQPFRDVAQFQGDASSIACSFEASRRPDGP